ncbi:hypothetical protein MRB53_020118 [Persea americana]|uniref:Uncharacterized protein n=1 Tax=Persea americana TaxID=3435 RepID=A0ACC2L0Y1_PERAE|nr:hypothetical protein MRB53_020118 [Persea americana]
MDITEASILHHVGIVFVLLWFLSYLGLCYPVVYFMAFIYLFQVNERYTLKSQRRLHFQERKQANQGRLLSDSETVRWLNQALEKIWPICMENIASQEILLPIIPWFLDKYKPWTVRKAVVQELCLGRNPPMFTEMRALRHSTDDDHLVLELGMCFLSADDMSAILAVKLRKRLGFGIWTKMHITGIHMEGKVLVGVKFLSHWPFLGRLRVCFVEPPYFQMTVKPIFHHGVNVTELPGIAGWIDKILAVAFEQTLVEPNMLVVDVEKFTSSSTEPWFSMDEKCPIAFAKVEVVEATDMKPSDLNGLADPYVKGQFGPYRFRTKTCKNTLAPKWQEEFKIPINTWESSNVLLLEVRDKDHFVDVILGKCSVTIGDLRGGQRHEMWLPLQNVSKGRLHLAVTVLDPEAKEGEHLSDEEIPNEKEHTDSMTSETNQHELNEKAQKMADKFESIDIEGQQQTGIWVHHPGSDAFQTWEPRKKKGRHPETQIYREQNNSMDSPGSVASGSYHNDSTTDDETPEGKRLHPVATIRNSIKKFSLIFNRSPGNESSNKKEKAVPKPRVNIRSIGDKRIGVRFVAEAGNSVAVTDQKEDKEGLSSGKIEVESEGKGHMRGVAKSFLKQAGKSAHKIKDAMGLKSTIKSKGAPGSAAEEKDHQTSCSSDEESLPSSKEFPLTVEGIAADSAFLPLNGKESSDSSGDFPANVQLDPSARNNQESLERKVSFHGNDDGKDDYAIGCGEPIDASSRCANDDAVKE